MSMTSFITVPTHNILNNLPLLISSPCPIFTSSYFFFQSRIRPLPLGYLIAIGPLFLSCEVYKIFLSSISFLGAEIIKLGMHLK